MVNLNKVQINGLLAELAYLKLESKEFINASTKEKLDYRKYDDLARFIKRGKPISDIDPSHQEQILNVLKQYEIVDFKSFTDVNVIDSDLEVMLLKDKNGEYTISYRGTARARGQGLTFD